MLRWSVTTYRKSCFQSVLLKVETWVACRYYMPRPEEILYFQEICNYNKEPPCKFSGNHVTSRCHLAIGSSATQNQGLASASATGQGFGACRSSSRSGRCDRIFLYIGYLHPIWKIYIPRCKIEKPISFFKLSLGSTLTVKRTFFVKRSMFFGTEFVYKLRTVLI